MFFLISLVRYQSETGQNFSANIPCVWKYYDPTHAGVQKVFTYMNYFNDVKSRSVSACPQTCDVYGQKQSIARRTNINLVTFSDWSDSLRHDNLLEIKLEDGNYIKQRVYKC